MTTPTQSLCFTPPRHGFATSPASCRTNRLALPTSLIEEGSLYDSPTPVPSLLALEKDVNGDVMWVWSYPSIDPAFRDLLMKKCTLVQGNETEEAPALDYSFGHYAEAWFYMLNQKTNKISKVYYAIDSIPLTTLCWSVFLAYLVISFADPTVGDVILCRDRCQSKSCVGDVFSSGHPFKLCVWTQSRISIPRSTSILPRYCAVSIRTQAVR